MRCNKLLFLLFTAATAVTAVMPPEEDECGHDWDRYEPLIMVEAATDILSSNWEPEDNDPVAGFTLWRWW